MGRSGLGARVCGIGMICFMGRGWHVPVCWNCLMRELGGGLEEPDHEVILLDNGENIYFVIGGWINKNMRRVEPVDYVDC